MTISVLLVGDNPTVREELQTLLVKQADIELLSQTDSQVALDLLDRRSVDVIVLDLQLQTPTSILTATHLRSGSAGPAVILLSIQEDVRYVKASFKSGVAGYLLRECAYEELPKAIRVVADGNCYLSPQIAEAMPNGFVHGVCEPGKP